MMQERTRRAGQQAKKQAVHLLRHPKRLEILFHFIKTGKLVKRLLVDRRVPALRKVAFGGVVAFLLALLLIPDLEVLLAGTVLPVIGEVLGIPLDAGLDWAVFALFATNMLRLFPQEFVTEHYENIFHDGKKVYIDAEEWEQLR
ncbi:hypothetical protein [Ktedonospora formicarum]|uniref:Uncharacterized protein n=1 Tax=Ktedonospora formicarum TaxID=2778364 RepID=A0A8J3HZW6_9CHLR|nr:hypothetical protein [Ktedonospora formicarum]GHO44205.1 hypothetical protein KSX_23680 [Ktedonospora formicarum]